jgi:hypothetical protein
MRDPLPASNSTSKPNKTTMGPAAGNVGSISTIPPARNILASGVIKQAGRGTLVKTGLSLKRILTSQARRLFCQRTIRYQSPLTELVRLENQRQRCCRFAVEETATYATQAKFPIVRKERRKSVSAVERRPVPTQSLYRLRLPA